jgi:site-specific DNA-methyltransferase (adenine-specific)
MKARLKDSFGLDDVEVIGQPTEVEGAKQLLTQSNDGRYQFQWWALGLVDAKPLGGVQKKGADKGIDGKITFTDEHGRLEQVLVSVKSGHVDSSQIRDLKGTLEREKAVIGLFITLEEPSRHMKEEAATAGLWHSAVWNRDFQRIQILTIRELLEEHRKPDLPAFVHAPYQRAERVDVPIAAEQAELFGG